MIGLTRFYLGGSKGGNDECTDDFYKSMIREKITEFLDRKASLQKKIKIHLIKNLK